MSQLEQLLGRLHKSFPVKTLGRTELRNGLADAVREALRGTIVEIRNEKRPKERCAVFSSSLPPLPERWGTLSESCHDGGHGSVASKFGRPTPAPSPCVCQHGELPPKLNLRLPSDGAQPPLTAPTRNRL